MTPTTGTALALLVAFALPGFVVALFQERTFKQAEDLSPLNLLLRVAYYSVGCYAVLAAVSLAFRLDRPWAEALYRTHAQDPATLVFYAVAAIFGPALLIWAWTLFLFQSGLTDRIATWFKLNTRHQQPTAWDFWFRKRSHGYVHVLYDDRSVWGYYGDKSFAAYTKDGGDLYLQTVFYEDDQPEDPSPDAPRGGPWFGKAKPDCLGAWVKIDDAIAVEFYNFGPTDEPRQSLFRRIARRTRHGATTTNPPESAAVAREGTRQVGPTGSHEQTETNASSPNPSETSEVAQ